MKFRLLKYLSPVLQPVYRQYLSRTRPFRYKDIRILVRPTVFYPGLTFSTGLLLNFIETLDLHGKTLLELGAGSGILSLSAASNGAIVTASEINHVAVQNIRENALMNHIPVTVIESDLFKELLPEVFDFILINPPYYPQDPVNYDEMAWFCGRNFEYFDKLFQQLPAFYSDSTQILMILSEDCNIAAIKDIGVRHGFSFSLLQKTRKLGEWNYIFQILKVS